MKKHILIFLLIGIAFSAHSQSNTYPPNGFGITFGGGYNFDSGKMTDYLSRNGGMNINLHGFYKRFVFGLEMMPAFPTIKQDILLQQNSYIWERGESITLSRVAPSFGIRLIESGRFSLIPFAGISFNYAGYSEDEIEDNPDLRKLKFPTSVTPIVGVDLDFTITQLKAFDITPVLKAGIRATYWPNVITTQGGSMRGQTLFVGVNLKLNFYFF